MLSSLSQKISSPSPLESGSEPDPENKVWQKIWKIVFSPLKMDHFFNDLSPHNLIDKFNLDESNPQLTQYVQRIRYFVKALARFDDVRVPTAKPLIHALSYETINYLQSRAYTQQKKNKSLIFDVLLTKKYLCDLSMIQKIAKITTDAALSDKDSVCEMAYPAPVEVYIETGPAKALPTVSKQLMERAHLYSVRPHMANMFQLWKELRPHFLQMRRIHVSTNIPGIQEACIQSNDFHFNKFVTALYFYRSMIDHCPKPCGPGAKAATLLARYWYELADTLSNTSSGLEIRFQNFFNAWWGFAIEELDFPALTLHFKNHFPDFFLHRKNEIPHYSDSNKLGELSFIAHEILHYLEVGQFSEPLLHARATNCMFSITSRILLKDRYPLDHSKVTTALLSAYYVSHKANITITQADSWIPTFNGVDHSRKVAFAKACQKYFFLISKIPGDMLARIGMIDFFSAYLAFATGTLDDPLPEFTNIIPELLVTTARENTSACFDTLRDSGSFEASLVDTIKILYGFECIDTESSIAKTILKDFPNSLSFILRGATPFDKIDQELRDCLASKIQKLKAARLNISNDELPLHLRPIALLWIETLRNTAFHHIDQLTIDERQDIFENLNEQMEFCAPPIDIQMFDGLVEMTPWSFSLLTTPKKTKIFNTDAPFARFLNRIFIQLIKVSPLSSTYPLINHYMQSYGRNLNSDIGWIYSYYPKTLRSLHAILRGLKTKWLTPTHKHLILNLLIRFYIDWLNAIATSIDKLPATAKKWTSFASQYSDLIEQYYPKGQMPKMRGFNIALNVAKSQVRAEKESLKSQFKNLVLFETNNQKIPISPKKLEIIRDAIAIPALEKGLTKPTLPTIGKFAHESIDKLEFISVENETQKNLNELMSFSQSFVDELYQSKHLRVAFEELLLKIADNQLLEDLTPLNTFVIEWYHAAAKTKAFTSIQPFLPPALENVDERQRHLIQAICKRWLPTLPEDPFTRTNPALEKALLPFLEHGLKAPNFSEAKKKLMLAVLIISQPIDWISDEALLPANILSLAKSKFDSEALNLLLAKCVYANNPYELIAPLCLKLDNARVLKENNFTADNLQKAQLKFTSLTQIQLDWLNIENLRAIENLNGEISEDRFKLITRRRRKIKKLKQAVLLDRTSTIKSKNDSTAVEAPKAKA